MKPIQIISQDLFDKIRSRFQNLEMGDETGAVTIDPYQARFFDFDFVLEGVNLGRVSISLNNLGSLKVYYSKGITEGQEDFPKQVWYDFLREMRKFAMRRLLRFDTRDISKSNLDKKDFQYLANKQIVNKEKVSEQVYKISDFKNNTFESMGELRKWMRSPKDNNRGMTRRSVDLYENIFINDSRILESNKIFSLKKQEARIFSDKFKQLDQRVQVQIKVGNSISLISVTLIPSDTESKIELSGFITPKKIVKINVDQSNQIDSIEFNDGTIFPEAAEFTTVGGVNITNTAFFRDRQSASRAYTTVWMWVNYLESKDWKIEHYMSENTNLTNQPVNKEEVMSNESQWNNERTKKTERAVAETRMPSIVIKRKQQLANMTDEEFAEKFKDKTDDELRSTAWRHGYEKNSPYYVNKRNRGKEKMEKKLQESKWNSRNSRKTSRAVKGRTEVIVRHNKSVDETYPGARSQRKNIKAIFIQNADGERFKYPFIHPAGAFAMAQHVDHGGVPHDPAGKAIMRMSEQIAQLQEFQRHVQRSQLHDDAMGIASRAQSKLMELKRTIEALGKRNHYESWINEFDDSLTDDSLMELDPVTMEDYKNKFTQTNFKEELAKYFPLIHKIMQETNSINLEEYVNEDDDLHTVHCSQCGGEFKSRDSSGFSHCKDHAGMKNLDVSENRKVNEFEQFEQWADAVEQGKLTDDQIKGLRNELESLQQPLELDTAYNFFNQFGIDDSDLEKAFDQAKDLDPEIDPLEVFQTWAQENYPELLVALGMSGTVAQEPTVESDLRNPDWLEDPEAYAARIRGRRPTRSKYDTDDSWPDDDQPQPSEPSTVKKQADVKYSSKEGTAPNGESYNKIMLITSKTPEQADYELRKFNDLHWGAKKIVDIKKKNPEDANGLYTTIAYYVDNHKYGYMKPWKDQEPTVESSEPVNRSRIVKEVAKIVEKFYNRDNPEVGPFRGEENILLDVEKTISELFGGKSAKQARQLAERFIEKLTNEWQERHGQTSVADDGLARLKELANIIKTRVEGIGDRGHSGRDFNVNIMSAEDEIDDAEKAKKKIKIPAYQRKAQGGDWKVTQRDLDKIPAGTRTTKPGLAAHAKRFGLDEEGLSGSLSKSDYMPGATVKATNSNCTKCHGRKFLYKTTDGKLHADNKQGAKKVKCPVCKGLGSKVVKEATGDKKFDAMMGRITDPDQARANLAVGSATNPQKLNPSDINEISFFNYGDHVLSNLKKIAEKVIADPKIFAQYDEAISNQEYDKIWQWMLEALKTDHKSLWELNAVLEDVQPLTWFVYAYEEDGFQQFLDAWENYKKGVQDLDEQGVAEGSYPNNINSDLERIKYLSGLKK